MLGLIAGVCAGCCIDKNALIALTFDDLDHEDEEEGGDDDDDEVECAPDAAMIRTP